VTDAVEKLRNEHGARNNRIRRNGCLNRCCVRDSSFESKLLVPTLQIVFQQHRPDPDMQAITQNVDVGKLWRSA
jgi:hypothetical protein